MRPTWWTRRRRCSTRKASPSPPTATASATKSTPKIDLHMEAAGRRRVVRVPAPERQGDLGLGAASVVLQFRRRTADFGFTRWASRPTASGHSAVYNVPKGNEGAAPGRPVRHRLGSDPVFGRSAAGNTGPVPPPMLLACSTDRRETSRRPTIAGPTAEVIGRINGEMNSMPGRTDMPTLRTTPPQGDGVRAEAHRQPIRPRGAEAGPARNCALRRAGALCAAASAVLGSCASRRSAVMGAGRRHPVAPPGACGRPAALVVLAMGPCPGPCLRSCDAASNRPCRQTSPMTRAHAAPSLFTRNALIRNARIGAFRSGDNCP